MQHLTDDFYSSTATIASRSIMSSMTPATVDSLSSAIAAMSMDVDSTPATNVTSCTAILPQPESRLLSLPTELRLLICGSMTLSPQYAESLSFRGAYASCRRLHQDMRDQLDPGQDLPRYIASKAGTWDHQLHSKIKLGQPRPFLGLIWDVTIQVPVPTRHHWQPSCHEVVSSLFSLYLDRLHIVMTGSQFQALAYNDMKSFRDSYFMEYVTQGKVNCRAVTFTIDFLSNTDGGRKRSTTIENVEPKSGITYQLTMVESKTGKQVERTFASGSRFKSNSHGPTSSFDGDD